MRHRQFLGTSARRWQLVFAAATSIVTCVYIAFSALILCKFNVVDASDLARSQSSNQGGASTYPFSTCVGRRSYPLTPRPADKL
jgi:hypothetical protein